jgi:surfactin synthase thioesterase subunit
MTEVQHLIARFTPQRRALLRELLANRRGKADRIRRRDGHGPACSSFAQARLWLVDQLEQGASAYHVPLPIRFRGPLDTAALGASLSDIVRRHEALRTAFRQDEDGVLQIVQPAEPVPLPVTDLAGMAADAQLAAVRQALSDEQTRAFDLSRGPLLRARLLRLAPAEHVLLIAVHHIGFDGWSVPIFHTELANGYNARASGASLQPVELPLQYANYAVWQRERMTGAALDKLLGYWTDRLAGVRPLELPTDRPVAEVTSTYGGTRSTGLSAATMARLTGIAKAEGASLTMAMSAILAVLFSRYTGQEDVALGTTSAARDRAELHQMIGFFANTFVVRADVSGAPTFRQMLQRTRATALSDYAHAALPFDLLVDHLRPQRVGNRMPLIRVHFQVEESTGTLSAYEELPSYAGVQAEGMVPDFVTAKFDLSFTLRAAADGSMIDVVYSADLYDGSTIERMLDHLRGLIEGLVADPDRIVAELPIPRLTTPGGGADAARQPAAGQPPAEVDSATIERVRAIWREVLDVTEIGLHDDFFDLGGNSFAMIKVRRALGGGFPMVELFRHRTVLGLAGYLDGLSGTGAEHGQRLLHELTPPDRTADLTLVCLPYAGGNATAYQPLADRLPGRFAVWAASLPGHEAGDEDTELLSLPDATTQLADEVAERVTGPMIIYGQCAGASLAISLARELEDRGVQLRAAYLGASLTDPDAAANLPLATDSDDAQLYGYIRAIGGFDGPLEWADVQQVLRALRHDMVDATRFQMVSHAQPPRKVRAPVSCLLGDADPATPDFATRYRDWELFAESVELEVLPGAGHYFIRDRADEVAMIIDRDNQPETQRIPLICLPFAGAGASVFYPWRTSSADQLEIIPVELPGHEKRFAEDLVRGVPEAVDGLVTDVLRVLGGRRRVILFGHCLGGVLAYEVAHRLVDTAGIEVAHLVVSGTPGPSVRRELRATGLPDAEFLARVNELAGYRHPALDDPAMREFLLPVLRADLEMYESYRCATNAPLPAPITAIRGRDDELVSAADAAAWRTATTDALRLIDVPGGHMYLTDHVEQVLKLAREIPA